MQPNLATAKFPNCRKLWTENLEIGCSKRVKMYRQYVTVKTDGQQTQLKKCIAKYKNVCICGSTNKLRRRTDNGKRKRKNPARERAAWSKQRWASPACGSIIKRNSTLTWNQVRAYLSQTKLHENPEEVPAPASEREPPTRCANRFGWAFLLCRAQFGYLFIIYFSYKI